jgi:hypothetical protein
MAPQRSKGQPTDIGSAGISQNLSSADRMTH